MYMKRLFWAGFEEPSVPYSQDWCDLEAALHSSKAMCLGSDYTVFEFELHYLITL